MTTPTANKFNRTGDPRQYLTGYITPATVATDDSTTAAAIAAGVSDVNAVFASSVLTIKLGFAPRSFKIINTTSGSKQEWFEGMAANQCIETITNGAPSLETDVFLVTGRTGTGGSVSQAAGTAGSSTDYTITVQADILVIAGQTACWVVEG